jgi:AraC-like DNA-binding protein
VSENSVLHVNSFDLLQIAQTKQYPFSRENFLAKVKPELGDGTFIWYNLGNGVAAYTYAYVLHQDTITSLSSDIPGAVLVFNLGDDFTHVFKNKTQYLIKKNSFFIGFSSHAFCMEMQMQKGKRYRTITIGIKEELLFHLISNYQEVYTKMAAETQQNGYAVLEGGEIDLRQLEILKAFDEHAMDENLLNVLYLEAHVMYLAHYTIERMMSTMHKIADFSLDIKTIHSLEKARHIILHEYDKELSIKQIAYRSAINECYLKKDFKAYYGMTVYEMLQKQRLDVAKTLLQSNHSVKEAAFKVGYKHTGNFSKRFVEHFGISPSVYRKQLL